MDPRKVRKIWQLIYDAFGFDIPVEAIKSKIYSRRSNQINQSRRWQITFWWSPWSLVTLSCIWPPRNPPPSQGLSWPLWGWPHCRQQIRPAQIYMKQLALGRPPWRAWQEGGTETRDDLWASPLVGLYLHTEDTLQWRHQDCLESISKLWMLVSSEQHCFFRMGGMAVCRLKR